MDISTKIKEICTSHVDAMGYNVVRVQLSGSMRKCLQIMIERKDTSPLGADDCESVSRALSVLFDAEEVISDAYDLEVSSPGIDRPLMDAIDFKKFKGKDIIVKRKILLEDRKSFTGELIEANDENFSLKLTEPLQNGSTTVNMSYEDIKSACLHIDYNKLLRG